MTQDEFHVLGLGDVVRHTPTAHLYLVAGSYGDAVTVVRTELVRQPDEWEVAWKVASPPPRPPPPLVSHLPPKRPRKATG